MQKVDVRGMSVDYRLLDDPFLVVDLRKSLCERTTSRGAQAAALISFLFVAMGWIFVSLATADVPVNNKLSLYGDFRMGSEQDHVDRVRTNDWDRKRARPWTWFRFKFKATDKIDNGKYVGHTRHHNRYYNRHHNRHRNNDTHWIVRGNSDGNWNIHMRGEW
ncbi:MAG: hypothetical protein VYC17_06525 [Nitrospinota bacterium]|nr:hypothetical protein [Nitrospinota bacterium]